MTSKQKEKNVIEGEYQRKPQSKSGIIAFFKSDEGIIKLNSVNA